MNNYNLFAEFYDSLTENVDYKVRSDYISNFFSTSGKGKGKGSVLDLACGTGSISKYLCMKGYSVIGMDLSDEMLTVAASKLIEGLTLVKGDMTEFSLPYKVDYCVCSLDAINHITDYSDVIKCFKCVYDSLNVGGVFVFDVNTIHKHKNILGNNSFVFDEENYFLAWENYFTEPDTVDIYLDFFVYNGSNYDRFSEHIKEKAYSIDSLRKGLKMYGFEIVGIYDELTEIEPKDNSERVYFVCRKV